VGLERRVASGSSAIHVRFRPTTCDTRCAACLRPRVRPFHRLFFSLRNLASNPAFLALRALRLYGTLLPEAEAAPVCHPPPRALTSRVLAFTRCPRIWMARRTAAGRRPPAPWRAGCAPIFTRG